jgi:hypothetical protein
MMIAETEGKKEKERERKKEKERGSLLIEALF